MKSIKEAYRKFLNTDEGTYLYNEFKRILYTENDSLVEILNSGILQNLPLYKKRTLQVCDIGGGDGRRTVQILNYLNARFKNCFHLDFIEQSKQYIASFDTENIRSFCVTGKYHDLFENVNIPEKHYDLVFLIHSIFAFDSGRALDKVLSLPNDKGKVIVLSNAPDSFLGGLKALADEEYEDRRYEIDALLQDLDKRGVKYQHLPFQTRWAIETTHLDKYLATILQWITLGSYAHFDAEKRQEMADYIQRNTITCEGRVFFRENEVALVIPPL